MPVIDFTSSALLYRIKFGGGKQQMLSKACGLHKKNNIKIIDCCAGLGQDAFILASLGAEVVMCERQPDVQKALKVALDLASDHEASGPIIERMQLVCKDAIAWLPTADRADVIYLDPMFPHSNKTALNKKNMQCLQELIECDDDAEKLWQIAMDCKPKRVVVKRPNHGPDITNVVDPTYRLKGKSNRFDVYIL